MGTHENQATLSADTSKMGLRGAAGGRLDEDPDAAITVAGSAGYDAQVLGDVFKASHNSTTGIDEIVTLTSNAAAWTAGTFTITFGAVETAAIAYNATFGAIVSAIAALSTIKAAVQLVPVLPLQGLDNAAAVTAGDASDSFSVTGGSRVLKLRFKGRLGGQDVGAVTTTVTGITGGTPALTAAVAQAGVA